MKNFFDFGKMKPKANVAVRERVRKSDDELLLPDKKDIFLFVAAREIDRPEFEATAHKLKTIRAIEESNFSSGAPKLESSTEWFRVVPAEWIVTEFRPILERLQIKESFKQTVRQSKKFVKIQVTEQLDSTLSCYQILNFATAQFAKSVNGILFEPCSLKLYHFNDWEVREFEQENTVPSLFPFITVLSSREENRYRLTSHGLARFNLPELQLENVCESMNGSCVYLVNAIAQSLIEKIVDSRTKQAATLSLIEPLAVSTEAVVRGNRGKLPFQSCVPRVAEIQLSQKKHNGSIKLFANFDRDQAEQDSALRNILSTLSLPESDTISDFSQTS